MTPLVSIHSYFSIDTDLAGELRSLPEFVAGQGYNVVLASLDGSQRVEVRFVPDTEDELSRLELKATEASPLFQRVLGIVAYALAAHSDCLQLARLNKPAT